MLRDRSAYSSTFWAIYIGLMVVQVFALTFDGGRYLYARQEIGKAAVVEINKRAFRDSGELHPAGATYSWTQFYANMNNDYLSGLGVHSLVTGIRINDARDTVYVAISADISALFPSIVPKVLVQKTETAQVRSLGQ